MTQPDPPPDSGPGNDPKDGGGAAVRFREFSGWPRAFITAFAVTVSLAHIWFNTFGILPDLTKSMLHFAAFGMLCAVLFPLAPRRSSHRRFMLVVDVGLGSLTVACVIYLLVNEVALARRGFDYGLMDYAVGLLVMGLALEFARRTAGLIIPCIVLIGLSYVVWWGRFIPGTLGFPGLSLEVVLLRSTYNEDGMFGMIASISSSFVFMFILFGAFLMTSGAGEFIINLARAVAGRLVGGPGFVAVLGSALTGTISGSAVANTVSTGVITIPLMKRSGFPARFAAGVEASASTGGQLMPPIMGAGAFVMANLTNIPYLDIVAVSFLPAILFFLGIGFYVRITAKKERLQVSDRDAPRLLAVLKQGGIVFLLPIGVLIGLLVNNFTPTYAAGFAIVSVVVASWLTPRPMGPRLIIQALELGARNMILPAILLVTVGLIVNVIATTGLGNTFSLMISQWAGGNIIVAIVLIALASLILGMGLPVTAAYIVLATLSAPALSGMILESQLVTAIADGTVSDAARAVLMLAAPDRVEALGQPMTREAATELVALIPPEMQPLIREQVLSPAVMTTALLSAHMIIFWLSQDSNVTPPVCLTAFAAAAIAGTEPMRTGLTAWKIAKVLYIVPVLFAYTPFLSGDPLQALGIFLFATVGVYALVAAIEGHAEAPYPAIVRPVLAIAGMACMWPGVIGVQIAGLAFVVGFVVVNTAIGRRHAERI